MLNDTSHFLVAQQVVDGLPPPPPGGSQSVPFGQSALVSQSTPSYLVVVNGNSDALLAQVQQLQPIASMQEYNGQRFIQAGLYADLASAQQQVSTLAASGISAQVVSLTGGTTVSQAPTSYGSYGSGSMTTQTLPPPDLLPTTTVPSTPGEVEFGSSDPGLPPADRAAPQGERAYYVIIPSSGRNIEAVNSQIARLTSGMGIDGMVGTDTSRGSHVKVGPFNSRSAANRWTRYFRDFGMDARVSYGR